MENLGEEAQSTDPLFKPPPQSQGEETPEEKRFSKWSTVKQSLGKIQRMATESCECNLDRFDSKCRSEHPHGEARESSSPTSTHSEAGQKEDAATCNDRKCNEEMTAESLAKVPANEEHSGQSSKLQLKVTGQGETSGGNSRQEEVLQSYMTVMIALSLLYQTPRTSDPVRASSRGVPCEGSCPDWEETSGVEDDDQDYKSQVGEARHEGKDPYSSGTEDKRHCPTTTTQAGPPSTKQPVENDDEEKGGESQDSTPAGHIHDQKKHSLKRYFAESQVDIWQVNRTPIEHGDETFTGNDEPNKQNSPQDPVNDTPFESNTTNADGCFGHEEGSAIVTQTDRSAENPTGWSNTVDQEGISATVTADNEAAVTEEDSKKLPESKPVQAAQASVRNDQDDSTVNFEESAKQVNYSSEAENDQSKLMQVGTESTAKPGTVQNPGHPQAEFAEEVKDDPNKVTTQLEQSPRQERCESTDREDQIPDLFSNPTSDVQSDNPTSDVQSDDVIENESLDKQEHDTGLQIDGHDSGQSDGHDSGQSDGHDSGQSDGHDTGQIDGHDSGQNDGHNSGQNDEHDTDQNDEPDTGQNNEHDTGQSIEEDTGQNDGMPQQQGYTDNEAIGGCHEEHLVSPEGHHRAPEPVQPTLEGNPQEEYTHDVQQASASLQPDPDPQTSICGNVAAQTSEQVLESGQQQEAGQVLGTHDAEDAQTPLPQNTEEEATSPPFENVTYTAEPENPDEDDRTPSNENPSAEGFAHASGLPQRQDSSAGQAAGNSAAAPTPSRTSSVQRSVDDAIQFRQGVRRGVGGRGAGGCPWDGVVVNLRGGYVDMRCRLDAPRGRDCLPEVEQQARPRVPGFATSGGASAEGLDGSGDNGAGNLMQEFIHELRAQQQEGSPVCAMCDQLADTAFLHCRHTVVCRQCARHMTQGSYCPCGDPVLCFIWLG